MEKTKQTREKKLEVELGSIVVTTNAATSVSSARIGIALERHRNCDWGEGNESDRRLNDQALRDGGRLFSVYEYVRNIRLWVITEADRSYTTVMLPEDY